MSGIVSAHSRRSVTELVGWQWELLRTLDQGILGLRYTIEGDDGCNEEWP